MSKSKRFLFFFLFQASCVALCQIETKLTDPIIHKVLDEFIVHLQNTGKLKNSIFRIQNRVYSVEPGMAIDSLNKDSTSTKNWNAFKIVHGFFLENEKMNSTLDLKIPTYYTFYKGIPVLISTGFESFIEMDEAKVKKLKQMLTKYFSPPGILTVPSTWFVVVENGKYKKYKVDKIFR
jgi:hypothetical protein